ncbi:MAG: FAD-binding protein, partial [Erysipelotrichaceae bacterium]
DYQYDVVVAGFGAAGAVASKTAAENGASVLLVEKMEQGLEGGNSKVCGQLFAYGNGDEEATRTYYENLAAELPIADDVLDTLVAGVANMREILNEQFGVPMEDFMDWSSVPVINEMSPEYPWLEGSETVGLWTTHAGISDGYLYNIFQEYVFANSDSIDIWYESPAVHLIQDPVSNTVIGVQVERDGETLNIRALNGVVLATGGFEGNEEMVADYLGLGDYAVIGGQYNTGDGITMALEVGADLWHMEVYEGGFYNAGLSYDVEMGTTAAQFGIVSGSAITVGAGGKRYFPEDIFSKHGHVPNNGSWDNPSYPDDSYVVWDQKYMDTALENGSIPDEFLDDIISGDTIEELALNAGIDAEALAVTIANYNTYANEGFDPEFDRSAESMTAFDDEGPYYAVYVKPSILNTQGGPRKNGEAQVLDVQGEVIPNLYVAGELGGVTSHQYQGGTNIAECITFGIKAGENAATEKDPLPAYTIEVVESDPILPGVVSDYAAFEIDLEDDQYLGQGTGIGGALYVVVTMDGSTIVNIEVVSHSETDGISDPAFETVPSAIIDAQSTEVDTVSGATITSNAIIEAVNDALSQVE